MIQDIDNHIQTVKDSLGWAREFRKDSFPTEQFNVFSTAVCPDSWKNECKFGAILFRPAVRGAGPYASERSPPSDKCGPDLSNRVPAISA